MDEQLKSLLEGINALKSGQEETKERMEKDLEKKLLVSGNKNESKILPSSPEHVSTSPVPVTASTVTVKLSTYDGKMNWELAAPLRGEADEILQTLPDAERLNLNSLYNALDFRFGQKYSKEYVRLQMKTRLQKTGESLQEYASEVERLDNLAFSDHPATVREAISLQYFVDGLKDGEIQKAVRMADVQDLKSVLLYALKVEGAREASCRDSHSVRGARVTTDAPCESPWRKEIGKLRKEIQDLMAQRQNLRRRRITCWGALEQGSDENGDVHSNRSCLERSKNLSNSLNVEKKFGVIDPLFHQITTPSTSALDPWRDESVRKDQLADPEIKPIIEFKESSDEKPSWQDIAPFHPTKKCYWALWNYLRLRNAVLYRKWESDDGKTSRWQLIRPQIRISAVLKELHGSPTGGHFGVMKTLQKVRELFYWNYVQSNVETCYRICDPCVARKGPRKRTKGRHCSCLMWERLSNE
ncbi:uncharacterized protein TNCV_4087661 [Trichonephila clavipes]|uniref:Integrase zinc-binding domain-containing protein n=1 Tax=Trichonephila clavipes TaxID=2585209 RepID=A0A8X6RJD5_TRICX|nr:uncharacterized protein TNCV_4087661 [Trichonephila clavipes]